MLVSHQIKVNSTFKYKDYQLTVVEKKTSSVVVKNTKGQTFTMDIKTLMEDHRQGFCEFSSK
jgi:hypothetical protein